MSTFGSFSTVKLGIYAAQKGLDVTGNNITNINTEGYTRQRLQQTSLVTSAADRYYSIYKTRVGQGVVTTGVTQLREPGLDLAYRNSTSDLGAADAKLAGLEDLAQILDEVGKGDLEQDDGVILNQLNDLRDLINEAITNGIEEYDGLIRTSAQALCTLFNSTANSLTELQGRYEERLTQQVDTINSILTNLRDLNVSIRNADIRGDNALELRDERNRLLDELSQYVKIDVQYTMEDVGAGFMVEKMTVSLATGDRNALVDGAYAGTMRINNANGNYDIELGALRDADGKKQDINAIDPVVLGDTALYGALQSTREILTEKGEYSLDADVTRDSNANVKRGIPYYQKALDNLAYEFAEQMNALNHIYDGGGNLVSGGNLFSMGSNTNDAYPQFEPGATDVEMSLLLNRPGTIYYVIAPKVGGILTTDTNGNNYSNDTYYNTLPEEGDVNITVNMPTFNQPEVRSILNPEASYSNNPNIKYGNIACQSSVVELQVEDLNPLTDYIVYS